MALIPCPEIPAALAKGLPPPGSAQWCAWIDDLTRFTAEVGATVSKWVDANMDYWLIRKALADYHNALLDAETPARNIAFPTRKVWRQLVGIIIELIDREFRGLDVLKDILRCAWGWHRVVLPGINVEAYIGCMLMKNVLATIRSFEAGPEWVAKLTIKIVVDIPALDEALNHLMDYLLPMQMPSEGEATEAWLRGYIDEPTRDCVWKYHGHNPEGYLPYVLGRSERIGTSEAMQFARRIGGGHDEERLWLRRVGWIDEEMISAQQLLYDQLPTISDHLNWLRTNVFDDEYVARYQLMSGFEERFWSKFGGDLRALGMKKENAALHYASHWIQPTPSEMREFVFRLRADKPGVANPFTPDDYERILAEKDVSPLARKWFRETMYRVPNSDARIRMYRGNLITKEQLVSYHRDDGYNEHDATALGDRDEQMKVKYRASQLSLWTPQSVGIAYAAGLIDVHRVDELVRPFGATADERNNLMERASATYQATILKRAKSRLLTSTISQVKQAIRVGVMDTAQAATALQSVGWPAEQAQGIASIEDAAARVDRVKHAVNHLRTAFHAGEIALPYVRHALQQLGVVPSAIASYIAMWEIENTPGRKRRSAKQIVADVSEGAITVEDAAMRLGNLGYTDVDTRLYLADAQRAMITTEAARMAAHSGNGRPLASELARVAHAAQGLSRRVVGELKQQASPARLKSYFVGGLIDEGEVRSRLQLYDWEPSSIDLFVADAKAAKEKKNAPKQSKSKPTPPGGAPSGSDTVGVGPSATAVP